VLGRQGLRPKGACVNAFLVNPDGTIFARTGASVMACRTK
jgi:hypothetical protein